MTFMLTEHYEAATERAAVVEEDQFGVIQLTGVERLTWLQGMVTNNVESLAPGQGCYAAHLNAQGRVLAQMTVLVDQESVWLALERSAVGVLLGSFDKLIVMEDVLAQDASSEYEILGVVGPRARTVLETWLKEPLNLDGLYGHRRMGPWRVAVSPLGYDLWVPRGRADEAVRGISESGATAIEHGVWDVLRTEAGLPVYGVDIDETTTMPELGERGIDYDKGCYIGQEVVARIRYIGHVNRRFVGFLADGAAPPGIRSAVRVGGKDVGYITTSLFSPGLKRPIALGFVNRAAASPGMAVELAGPERTIQATVTALPFIPRGGG
jgi:folate-binding protein YgfZ